MQQKDLDEAIPTEGLGDETLVYDNEEKDETSNIANRTRSKRISFGNETEIEKPEEAKLDMVGAYYVSVSNNEDLT